MSRALADKLWGEADKKTPAYFAASKYLLRVPLTTLVDGFGINIVGAETSLVVAERRERGGVFILTATKPLAKPPGRVIDMASRQPYAYNERSDWPEHKNQISTALRKLGLTAISTKPRAMEPYLRVNFDVLRIGDGGANARTHTGTVVLPYLAVIASATRRPTELSNHVPEALRGKPPTNIIFSDSLHHEVNLAMVALGEEVA